MTLVIILCTHMFSPWLYNQGVSYVMFIHCISIHGIQLILLYCIIDRYTVYSYHIYSLLLLCFPFGLQILDGYLHSHLLHGIRAFRVSLVCHFERILVQFGVLHFLGFLLQVKIGACQVKFVVIIGLKRFEKIRITFCFIQIKHQRPNLQSFECGYQSHERSTILEHFGLNQTSSSCLEGSRIPTSPINSPKSSTITLS